MSSNHPDKSHTTPAKKDDQPSSTTNKNKENDPSLLTRIQNSASSLIQDSLTRPSGATLSTDLAHVLDSGSKGFPSASSSGSSGSTWSTESWRSAGPGGSSSSAARQGDSNFHGPSNERFRSAQADGGRGIDASEFDSFQNSGFFQTDDAFISNNKEEGKGKGRDQPIYNDRNYSHEQGMLLDVNDYVDDYDYESTHFNAYEIAWINASRLGTVYRSPPSTTSKRLSQQSSMSEINASTLQIQSRNGDENDGKEVVNLLSDPEFQPGLSTWDDNDDNGMDTHESGFGFDDDFNDDPLDAEGFPIHIAMGLSPAEMQIIDFFRRQQQTDSQSEVQQKKITPYSLVPDIDSFLTQHNSINNISDSNDALRNEVVANLIGAEEWLIVDERYNDDVWGYLRPAVEAAAAEIQQQKEENPVREGEDGPAVKRLKMILRHMARL